MLTRKIIGLCLGLMLSHASVAQTVYQVSIGSYKSQANAEKAAAKAARELGDRLLRRGHTNGQWYLV